MKKVTAILFAVIILLTGMHLSFATHICRGKVADVKWSFSGKLAACGMEDMSESCPVKKSVSSKCCSNDLDYLKVDDNYKPVSVKVNDIAKEIVHVYLMPLTIAFYRATYLIPISANASPPGRSISNMVSLTDICVFRI